MDGCIESESGVAMMVMTTMVYLIECCSVQATAKSSVCFIFFDQHNTV